MDIIDLAVDFVILIVCALIGFTIYYATSTSGWTAPVVAIWGLLPVAFIGIGILALVVKIKYLHQ